MKEVIGKCMKKKGEWFYLVARVFIGFMFMTHGAQKLFGWFGKGPMDFLSLMGVAGVIEFAGGLLIMLGLFTRVAALISGLEMIGAFVIGHASNGIFPWANGGELALVYFAAFLMIIVFGSGSISLDQLAFKKEHF